MILTCARLPLLFILLLLQIGCGSSLHKSQYDRLKLGMSVSEVEEILGKGEVIQDAEVKRLVKESTAPSPGVDENTPIVKINPDSADFRGVRWGKEKKNIVVIYQNERLFRAFRHGL